MRKCAVLILQGSGVIEPPREGTLHRAKKLISELSNTLSATAYREERGSASRGGLKLPVRSEPPKGRGGPERGPRLPEAHLRLNNMTMPRDGLLQRVTLGPYTAADEKDML